MKRIRFLCVALVFLGGCDGFTSSAPGHPEASGSATSGPAAYVAGTESWVMRSSVGEREYQISVAVPRGYADADRDYPVLYAVDANGMFGTVVETARLLQLSNLVPELVVVGIGYPVGHYVDAISDRVFDLNPTVDLVWEQNVVRVFPDLIDPEEWRSARRSGGAPGFLRFLQFDLIPMIEAEYRVLRDDRAFLGHSAGGLFALYALLHSDGTFQRVVSASPALWWDDRVMFEMESAFAASHRSLPARVFFSVGMLEGDELQAEGWGQWISNLRELDSVLERRDYEGLEWEVAFFDDEDHLSVVPISISRGLRYIYGRTGEQARSW